MEIFTDDRDYRYFTALMGDILQEFQAECWNYCIMPNHFHLLLWPQTPAHAKRLSDFMRWLTVTHTQRHHAHYHSAGTGHLYQGRFKSFAVQDDAHLLTVCRYVEANPLRAGLVTTAEAWRWSSLWRYASGDAQARALLARWPLPRPRAWVEYVNAPQTDAELESLRRAVRRSSPFGNLDWQQTIAKRLGLESTLRPRGRPRKLTTP